MLEQTADFVAGLRQAQDIDAIWSSLRRFAASHGLERVVLGATRIDAEQGTLVPVDYRTDLPADQFRDYLESGRYRCDPMFWAAQATERPLAAHLDTCRSLPMSPPMRELFESEIVQAWPFRMAMPVVVTPGGDRWSVVFGGAQTAKEASELVRAAAPALWLAASAAGLRLAGLDRIRASSETPLSTRERECLLRLAQGLRIDRIAERLGICAATVELHLANARRKLGARTSVEAVARAVQRGVIDP